MKRHGGLFDRIASFDNLFLASRKARKGKRFKDNVLRFESNIESELLHLREELLSGAYRPGSYTEFTVYERKPRKISAAPFRDRVVHHALCGVIEPIFERSFIHDSYACRPGRGTHAAVDRFTQFCRRSRYVLKMDIARYFPSIDHDILYEKIARKIKCERTLRLARLIIDGSNPQEPVHRHFPGDDLFTPLERRRGIPIGNLTSQFFANVYLDGLDHYAKETLGCRQYIRYVDDIVVFGDSKGLLWDIRDAIGSFLMFERLCLHPKKTLVLPVERGADYLGYRVFPSHRLVRKDTSMRFKRKLRALARLYGRGRIGWLEVNASVQSWLGHVKHADSHGLRRGVLGGAAFMRSREPARKAKTGENRLAICRPVL